MKFIINNMSDFLKRGLVLLAAIACCFMGVMMAPRPAFADDPPATDPSAASGGSDCTSLLPSDWCTSDSGEGIKKMVKFVVDLLAGGVVVVGTVGMVICGYTWMTARDNEAQVAKAKKRLVEIVIGMVVFVAIDLVVNLLGFAR